MSHTVQGSWSSPVIITPQFTIVNYTQGGEPVTAAEFGLTTVSGVLFALVGKGSNSLGVVLLPVLVGVNVMLFELSGGALVEIPTTANLNAAIVAMVISNPLATKLV